MDKGRQKEPSLSVSLEGQKEIPEGPTTKILEFVAWRLCPVCAASRAPESKDRPAPTPAGAEVIRQAAREGLTLATSGSSTGYKGVSYRPKKRGSKKYRLQVTVGGKKANLGLFATAEQAEFYATRYS